MSSPSSPKSLCSVCGTLCSFSHLPSNVFSIAKLIPAGSLELNLKSDSVPPSFSKIAEDGWPPMHAPTLESLDILLEEFTRPLSFLIRHHFIFTTYYLHSAHVLKLRVYIVPYDLPGCQGRLSYRARSREVLNAGQTYMLMLLPLVSQEPENWHGGQVTPSAFFLDSSMDRRTLPEIYGALPSPSPQSFTTDSDSINRLLDYRDDLGGFGLHSTLLFYQRRSVAMMLQKESGRSPDVPNPLYVPLTDMNGKICHYQPGTTEFLKELYMVTPTQGGVLCEELGTGKTIMILTLILSTIKQLSSPENSFIDSRPVLTPLALRHFPSGDFASIREKFSPRKRASQSQIRVPSFRDILLHLLSSNPDISIPNTTTESGLRKYQRQEHFLELLESLPYDLWRKSNFPFYLHQDDDPTGHRISSRGQGYSAPRLLYLTSATLIVAPANLISQWDREILKHCEVVPRVLIIRSGTRLPSAKDLATLYDIILMPYNRFSDEDKRTDVKKLHSWKLCVCPEFPDSRVPKCTCRPPDVSSLLQVRWKRLVIDEGHVSASLSTRLTPFSKLLSVQHRWIVTGTPTTNLLGLSFGNKSSGGESGVPSHADLDLNVGGDTDVEMDAEVGIVERMDVDFEVEQRVEESVPEPLATESSSSFLTADPDSPSSSPTPLDVETPRIWNRLDRLDVEKLTSMVAHFVGMKLLADQQIVKSHILDALFDNKGPRPGAIQMLTHLMESVMIRHRIDDVEEEVVLPRLDHEHIYLSLSPLAAMSYNAFQASIAINAIDSERQDEDYMFHPRNSDALQTTVKNMSQLLFWSVDDRLYNIDELKKTNLEVLQDVNKRNIPQADIELAKESYMHIYIAAESPLWRSIQSSEDIPYLVHGINPMIFKSWSRLPDNTWVKGGLTTGYVHPDRLIRLRQLIIRNPLISVTKVTYLGEMASAKDLEHRKAYQEMVRRKEGKERKDRKSERSKLPKHIPVKQQDTHNSTGLFNSSKTAASSDTIKEMQQELQASLARLEMEEGVLDPSAIPSPNATQPSALLHSSVIAGVRVGSSASTKLNYIINDVLKYSEQEKFLIFSDSELTLAHIAEALQLVEVKFLRFSTQVPTRIREQTVLTFETSDVYRVFLMELKHGARGLNLVSASRVIFCEPVWQIDVESQAIKRAHRIGQTRPVKVKTLAISNTAEEKMLERRQILKQGGSKIPKLLEETEIRHFIANPRFILVNPDAKDPGLDIPLLRLPPAPQLPASTTNNSIDVTCSSPLKRRVRVMDPQESSGGSPPKKRTVRFAE
ncbi:hypothetical protein D9758_000961 [Tetrapyrgos nigripes]|uniref:Helicase C-terminal domain-containing protein n=1 Tax=Tetrapyrgos nigripes TaxID=182062 RepID=A0A8H5GYU9_9AGAR|nr:hypothetical protein D9758_000961 [Tetrapyrgos nigripes]